MRAGKLPLDILANMLERLPPGDEQVLVGPRVGEDAAVVSLGGEALVAAMDPITFATDLIGWYGVNVNANDVAVMGAAPRWFLGALLIPTDCEEGVVSQIFDQIAKACRELGIIPIGGHTEVTPAVSQPTLVGCMLGEIARDRVVSSGGAQAGDDIILYGYLGIEGTALLAREAGEKLALEGIDEGMIEEARKLLFEPGINVVGPALAAAVVGVTAMHDPTESGLAGGLEELARASGIGLEVKGESLEMLPSTRIFCERLSLDPLGLIASGALLIAARPERSMEVLSALSSFPAKASIIGKALGPGEGLWLTEQGVRRPLRHFERDEIARFFEECAK